MPTLEEKRALLDKLRAEKAAQNLTPSQTMQAYSAVDPSGELGDMSKGPGEGPVSKVLDFPSAVGRTALATAQNLVASTPENITKPVKRLINGEPITVSELGQQTGLDEIIGTAGGPHEKLTEDLTGLALSVAVDPLLWTAPAGAAKGAAKATDAVGEGVAKTAGFLGEAMTQGKISREGMEAARSFSPIEQMRASNTLEKVGEVYGPQKAAMDEGRAGLRYLGETQFPSKGIEVLRDEGAGFIRQPERITKQYGNTSVEIPSADLGIPNFKQPGVIPAVTSFSKPSNELLTATNNLRKGLSDLGATGDAAANIERLRTTLTNIQRGDKVTPAELSGLLDQINRIEYSQLGNERAIWNNMKGSLIEVRDSAMGMLRDVAPEYTEARGAYHNAALMAQGHQGGRLSSMVRQASAASSAGDIASAAASGDVGQVATGLTGFLSHYPGPWNAVVGSLRLAGQPVDKLANLLVENPQLRTVFFTALDAEMQKANNPSLFQEQQEPGQTGLDAYLQKMETPPPPPRLGTAGELFMKSAAVRPELFGQLAQIMVKQGNVKYLPFLQLAGQIGMDGAMLQLQVTNPDLYQQVALELPRLATEAVKASPTLKGALRDNISTSGELSPERKAELIMKLNNGDLFNETLAENLPPS